MLLISSGNLTLLHVERLAGKRYEQQLSRRQKWPILTTKQPSKQNIFRLRNDKEFMKLTPTEFNQKESEAPARAFENVET